MTFLTLFDNIFHHFYTKFREYFNYISRTCLRIFCEQYLQHLANCIDKILRNFSKKICNNFLKIFATFFENSDKFRHLSRTNNKCDTNQSSLILEHRWFYGINYVRSWQAAKKIFFFCGQSTKRVAMYFFLWTFFLSLSRGQGGGANRLSGLSTKKNNFFYGFSYHEK